MSKDGQRLVDYLAHLLQAIERITRYTELLDEVDFLQNELVQDAVIRNLEILGEASNNVRREDCRDDAAVFSGWARSVWARPQPSSRVCLFSR